MTKIETITNEIEHCGECCSCDGEMNKFKCVSRGRIIPDLWGKIPKWCLLPDKEEK